MLNRRCSVLLLLYFVVFCSDVKGMASTEAPRLRRQPRGGDLTQCFVEDYFAGKKEQEVRQHSRQSQIAVTAQFFSDYNSPEQVANVLSMMYGSEADQAVHVRKQNRMSLVPCKRKRSRQSLSPSPSSSGSLTSETQTPFARMRSARSLSVTSMPSPGLSPIPNLSDGSPISYSEIPSPDFSCGSYSDDDRMDIDTPPVTPMTIAMKAPHPTPLNKVHGEGGDDEFIMGENQEEELPRMFPEDQVPVDIRAASAGYRAAVKRQIRMARCRPQFFTFSPQHIEKSNKRAQEKKEQRRLALSGGEVVGGAFSRVGPNASVSELEQEEKRLLGEIGAVQKKMALVQLEEAQTRGAAEQDGKLQLQENQAARKKSLEEKKTVVREKSKQHPVPSRFQSSMEKAFLSSIR